MWAGHLVMAETVAVCCERGNEHSDFIKRMELFDWSRH